MTQHYDRAPRRKAELIRPDNVLKQKAGSGGLADDILEKAQTLLEEKAQEFEPLAELYLGDLMKSIQDAGRGNKDTEAVVWSLLYPAMQLKANGQMFNYPLITQMADRLIQFLEIIGQPDNDVLEIIIAYHTTMHAVLQAKIAGEGGKNGQALLNALTNACVRYFEKHPENV